MNSSLIGPDVRCVYCNQTMAFVVSCSALGEPHSPVHTSPAEDDLLLPLPGPGDREALLQLLLEHHERLFGQPRRP